MDDHDQKLELIRKILKLTEGKTPKFVFPCLFALTQEKIKNEMEAATNQEDLDYLMMSLGDSISTLHYNLYQTYNEKTGVL
jgi:regulator of sigma D